MTTLVRWFIATLFVCVPLDPLSAQTAAKPAYKYAEAKHGPAELRYYGKIPVLTVSGTPEEIGEQIGVLQADVVQDIQKLIGGYVRFRGWQDTFPWLLKSGSLLEFNFPADHRREFSAAMKKGKLDRELLILVNTGFDIVSVFACSAIVAEPARSASGELVFGRNLDLPKFAYLHELTLVTVYRPKGKHAFATVGFPAVFGAISGMNDAGLSLAVNEVLETKDASVKYNPLGTPKLFLLRRVLEECATLDEAEKLIRDAGRTGMMAVTICDKKEGAILEITPKSVIRRRAIDGIATCTNHFRSKELCVGDKCDRLDALDVNGRKEKLSVANIGDALHAARLQDYTMQTMIFEPASLRLHLAFGEVPSSALPRETLDLAPLLRPLAK